MKKMKHAGLALIMAAAICGLTACGGNGKEAERENGEPETAQSVEANDSGRDDTQMADVETETDVDADATEPEAEETIEPDTEPAGETAMAMQPEEFIPVAGLSENYADLDKRCFAYNGQIFTLGESTFQDLIDGGVPFDDNSLNNVGNNVNSNYETDRYTVRINDYVSMQFSFINTTETNITEAECLLRLVRWYSIYVPQPDYEESLNEEIVSQINDAANSVCFAFPLTLTKEQLLENNSNATEIENNHIDYRIDSEVYMGDSGYTFKFNQKTDQLEDFNISWLP